MRNKLTVAIGFALAFIFGCSSDDDKGKNNEVVCEASKFASEKISTIEGGIKKAASSFINIGLLTFALRNG